jgi:ATP synthase F1 gamma subunit
MPVTQRLRDELQQVKALKVITGAFSEISALKINAIKSAFEQNSLYYEEISLLYHLLKRIASSSHIALSGNASTIDTHTKVLHVAVTSNHGFYGSLNSDTVDRVQKEGLQSNSTRIVIGSMGIEYARSANLLSPFEAVVFSKDEPSNEEIQAFLDKTGEYNRIFVYFPKFITMFSQRVDRIDITHSPELISSQREDIKYIIEPELPKMMAFFEKQVRYVLFRRVFLETSLSRTAARLISMDAAERRARKVVKKLHANITQVRQSVINAQLIASSGQLKKWRTHK